MFTYKELPDGRVSLEMDNADWVELLWVLGIALGAASRDGLDRGLVDFVNRVNRTNPRFQQYELPPESVPETKH